MEGQLSYTILLFLFAILGRSDGSHRKASNALKSEWNRVCSQSPVYFECSPSPPKATNNCDLQCNGNTLFCDLRFDQVTFAGTHNSGSGFDGGFGNWGKINDPFLDPSPFNCMGINQAMSIYDQLKYGIRYLEIDITYDACAGRLGTGHGFYCTGPVCKILDQLESWMRLHTTEVVVVQFNRDVDMPTEAFPQLVGELLKRFDPTGTRPVRMNDHFRRKKIWPTLREAITVNKRLFVFVANAYTNTNITLYYDHLWMHGRGASATKTTWEEGRDVTLFNRCHFMITDNKNMCERNKYAEILTLSMVGRLGLCIDDMASFCNDHINDAADQCYASRKSVNKVVNFIIVDFPRRGNDRISQSSHRLNVRSYLTFKPKRPQCVIRGRDLNNGYSNMTLIETMRPGQFIMSENRKFKATILCDGSFVTKYLHRDQWIVDNIIHKSSRAIGVLLALHPSGNVVLINNKHVVWESGSVGPDPVLSMLNNGTLAFYHDSNMVWQADTKNSRPCIWIGTEPFCRGACPSGFSELYTDKGYCWFGTKTFCCPK